MKPATAKYPWRKTLRVESKGVDHGRRSSHRVEMQSPRLGSSWWRRHKWMVNA